MVFDGLLAEDLERAEGEDRAGEFVVNREQRRAAERAKRKKGGKQGLERSRQQPAMETVYKGKFHRGRQGKSRR